MGRGKGEGGREKGEGGSGGGEGGRLKGEREKGLQNLATTKFNMGSPGRRPKSSKNSISHSNKEPKRILSHNSKVDNW